ncbi:esterase FE4 isoform X1 [Apis mellifera carnica]|nr:esterase FE4 isoform X1 [Apis mellifera carnica]
MASENTIVRVKQGELRGVVEETDYGDQYLAFRGIPYAKPPIGPLRFKDPEPLEPWSGIRDASKHGDVCAQNDTLFRQLKGSDDCLYLNVYRPVAESKTKRAVMVWIHGGAFMVGSGNDDIYGPDYLMRKDIVLVKINYRLGVLGFLNLEHEIAPGNQGLKDQVMALKWVQENISSFGGDPNNVTIFGESAGGGSVHYLTISPLAQGLFHKAIAQSGVAINPWAIITKEPSKYAYELAAKLGEKSTDPKTVLEFLRTVDAQKLAFTETQILKTNQPYVTFGTFAPCIDNKSPNPFMPRHPSEMMKTGIKVPLLIGYNENEGSSVINFLFQHVESEDVMQNVNENFEIVIPLELQPYLKKQSITPNDLKHYYFGKEIISEETKQKYADFMSDVMFLRGIHDVINIQMEKAAESTYMYKFTYDSEMSLLRMVMNVTLPGATHADELQYLFFPDLSKKLANRKLLEVGTDMYIIMEYFTQMWTDFAKTGNPTPKVTDLIRTIWKPLQKTDTYNYLRIDKTLKMESYSKSGQRFDWNRIKNKL